jgi:hypothetical protein
LLRLASYKGNRISQNQERIFDAMMSARNCNPKVPYSFCTEVLYYFHTVLLYYFHTVLILYSHTHTVLSYCTLILYSHTVLSYRPLILYPKVGLNRRDLIMETHVDESDRRPYASISDLDKLAGTVLLRHPYRPRPPACHSFAR